MEERQYFDSLQLSREKTHLQVVNAQEGFITPLRPDVVMYKRDFSNLEKGTMGVGPKGGAPFWRRQPFTSQKELDDYCEQVGHLFKELGR